MTPRMDTLRQKFSLGFWSALITVGGLCLAEESQPDRPTFSRDVAPILQENCQACHRPGEAAPMSLLTYEEARPWAKSIREKVAARTMPPWHANPEIGEWKNERRLTDAEIATILAWVDQGAAQGDPADLPPPREWTEGWLMGEPDMVFTITQEQILPADLIDEYRYLAIPMGLTEDVWIEAVEVRPGNRQVVHHVNVFETSQLYSASPEARAALEAARDRNRDEAGNVRNMSGEGLGPFGEPAGRVGGFLPGGMPFRVEPGEGVRLPKSASLLLQVHYHKETGEEARDLTKVGVRLAKGPVTQQIHGGAIDNCTFKIPAGDDNHEVVARLPIDRPIHLTAMSPHMHLRGKSFAVWADLPDGGRLDILDVPRYDFNWQTTYEPAEPIALPAGAVLRTRAFFDNSAGNAFNPDPTIDVQWGEPTTDEMMLMFFRYALDEATAPVSGDD